MKGFNLNSYGDVDIQENEIQMVDGNDLLRQTVQSVLGTNKGEWVLNDEEGITFSNLLGSIKEENIIRNEIQQGLSQVDSSFVISAFDIETDRKTRKLKISFTAYNDAGNEISGVRVYA